MKALLLFGVLVVGAVSVPMVEAGCCSSARCNLPSCSCPGSAGCPIWVAPDALLNVKGEQVSVRPQPVRPLVPVPQMTKKACFDVG